MRTEYVLGFAFCEDTVLLIKKQRPEGQKGQLNGLGGLVEEGELPKEAMIREFHEETGEGYTENWDHYCTLIFPDTLVSVYRGTIGRAILHACDASRLLLVPCQPLSLGNIPALPDLHWLIPMAQHSPRGMLQEIVVHDPT